MSYLQTGYKMIGALSSGVALPSGFSPISIAGLVLWLDANDPNNNGSQPANNSAVATWTDKSSSGHNFTQALGASQPIYKKNSLNSLPVMNFNNQWLDGSSTNIVQYTMFVVANTTQTVQTSVIYGNGNPGASGQTMMAITAPSKLFGMLYGGATWLEDGAPNTSYHVFAAQWNGAATTFYIGNVSTTISGSTIAPVAPSGTSKVGADGNNVNVLDGNVAEILLYNSSLSSSNVTLVYNYLHSKWGAA